MRRGNALNGPPATDTSATPLEARRRSYPQFTHTCCTSVLKFTVVWQILEDQNEGKNCGYVTLDSNVRIDSPETLASEALVFQVVGGATEQLNLLQYTQRLIQFYYTSIVSLNPFIESNSTLRSTYSSDLTIHEFKAQQR
ncbi:hypothetical protein J6590_077469 [Homalodisca vitripennis]|nr:hypothetical protein J6590_077469 [Homalodisca vitripennis]